MSLYPYLLRVGIVFACMICTTDIFGDDFRLIPYPSAIERHSGAFSLPDSPSVYPGMPAKAWDSLSCYLEQSPLHVGTVAEFPENADLRLVVNDDPEADPEAYRLEVTRKGIYIEASSDAGVFYGLQTLFQLKSQYGRSVPCVVIEDAPYLHYRGLMIDVSRHFFPKEFIMKQLDLMARYKFNRFHWHLVDGPGWRIEIKKYPELTQKAAWRTDESIAEWEQNGLGYADESTPGAYGGYYTQDDIREVVAYAASRHITVIPEIEMPGHNEEVLATFPSLVCAGMDGQRSTDLCIGNPVTYRFFEDVLTEIIELFPSEYIHIGGDEAVKTSWEQCSRCQNLLKEQGLDGVDALQSHLVRHFEKFLLSHGKKLIGWDEIMQGGLSPEATVMSWRGPQYGIEAAKAGHDAIMAPIQYCYFNFYQDSPYAHVLSYSGYIPLEKVYSYNPVPDSLGMEERSHILGIQANLWTEYIPVERQAEMMLWPRALAIAETGWTQPELKSYGRFRDNAVCAVRTLRDCGYFAFDIENEYGERKECADTLRHLAYGKSVTYNLPYTDEYPAAGESALTDGLRGGWDCGDGRWQGFIGDDMDVIVDLGKPQHVHDIHADFIQDRYGWFWMPGSVEIYTSFDNEHFTLLSTLPCNLSFTKEGFFLKTYGWQGDTVARYIRYVARQNHLNPKSGFIFTDEIVVR